MLWRHGWLDRLTFSFDDCGIGITQPIFFNPHQIHVKSATEHAELLRKVEIVNTLTSVNKKFHDDKDRLVKEAADLNAKVARLEAEKDAFNQESKRWQNRVDKLIEMRNNFEANEDRKLVIFVCI